MSYQGIQHSILVQRHIRHAKDADKEFSNIESNEIPIVLIPKSPLIYSFALNVPSGPFVLYQKWDKDMGELEPGVKWIMPFYKKISHIVTRATITYNSPARSVPTADNGTPYFISHFQFCDECSHNFCFQ